MLAERPPARRQARAQGRRQPAKRRRTATSTRWCARGGGLSDQREAPLAQSPSLSLGFSVAPRALETSVFQVFFNWDATSYAACTSSVWLTTAALNGVGMPERAASTSLSRLSTAWSSFALLPRIVAEK